MKRAWLVVVLLGACSGSGTKDAAGDGPDAAADDAPTDHAQGPELRDAPAQPSQRETDPPGYEAWWYPECETTDGHCPEDNCLRNHFVVAADWCSPYQEVTAGCVSRMTLVAGWLCFKRESSGQIVFSEFSPKGGDFVPCFPGGGAGLVPERSLCVDGGGTD